MIRALAVFALLVSAPVAHATDCPQFYQGGQAPRVSNPKLSIKARELCFTTFVVMHSGVAREPLWSAEHLTRASVKAALLYKDRDNQFHPEERLPADERALLSDYAKSGYDRGHMAPSGDTSTPATDHETFTLANMVPQSPSLNRHSWADLEGAMRTRASKSGDMWLVSGPLFETAPNKGIGALKGRVLIPTHTWKAFYVPSAGAGVYVATNDETPKWTLQSVASFAARSGDRKSVV